MKLQERLCVAAVAFTTFAIVAGTPMTAKAMLMSPVDATARYNREGSDIGTNAGGRGAILYTIDGSGFDPTTLGPDTQPAYGGTVAIATNPRDETSIAGRTPGIGTNGTVWYCSSGDCGGGSPGPADLPQHVYFDLGSELPVGSVVVWVNDDPTFFTVTQADIATTTDTPTSFDPDDLDALTWSPRVTDAALDETIGTGQTLAFISPVNTRYIRFTADSDTFTGAGNIYSINEFAVNIVTASPPQGPLISPVDATARSNRDGTDDGTNAGGRGASLYTIDGSGFDPDNLGPDTEPAYGGTLAIDTNPRDETSIAGRDPGIGTNGTAWYCGSGDCGGGSPGPADLPQHVYYDLGSLLPVESVVVWTYDNPNHFGVTQVDIATTTGTPGSFDPDGMDALTWTPEVADAPLDPMVGTGQTLAFGSPVETRYIRLTVEASTWPNAGDIYSLNEFAVTVVSEPLVLSVALSGSDELILKWNSKTGKLYNLRSETDPSAALPADWPIFETHQDIASTPPENTLVIPLPADPFRLFVIEEVIAPPVSLVSDDFESGAGDWTTGSDGLGGTVWELGVPSNVGPSNANSPTNCFGTNLSADYDFDAVVWLRSPVADLTSADSASLSYFQFFEIESDFDLGTVSLLDASDNSVLAVLVPLLDGSSAGWEEVSMSLPAAALGKAVRIEFRLDSDDVNNEAGWYIDDFDLTVP